MTVPIMPGPFAFLAALGQAGGEAVRAHNEDVDKKRKQAQDTLNQMIQLRGAGLLQPEQFGTPEAMKLYKTLGILPISDKPTPGEQISNIQGRFLAPDNGPKLNVPSVNIGGGPSAPISAQLPGTTGPMSVSDTERMVAKLPLRSEVARERQAATSGIQAAEAANQSTIQSFSDTMASRAVDAVIGQAGGNIITAAGRGGENIPKIIDAAWQVAQQDATSRGYTANEQLTKPFIQAQIAMKWREAQLLAAKMLSAQQGQDVTPRLLGLLQSQQTRIAAEMSAMPKPSDQERTYASLFSARIAGAKSDAERQKLSTDPSSAFLRQAYDRVQLYDQTMSNLTNELNGVRDLMQNALGQALPGTGGAIPGRTENKTTPEQRTTTVTMIRNGQATLENVKQLVAQGQITQADYALIEQELNNGAGAKQQTRTPQAGSRQ